jgi:hypothetical protein
MPRTGTNAKLPSRPSASSYELWRSTCQISVSADRECQIAIDDFAIQSSQPFRMDTGTAAIPE